MESWEIKNALERYHQYHRARDKAKEKLDIILAKREKVGGSIVKIPEPSAMSDGMKRIVNMEKYDKAVAEFERYSYQAQLADDFIASLSQPYKQMVWDKYVECAKSWQMEKIYGYSIRQTRRIFDVLIEKFVEQC